MSAHIHCSRTRDVSELHVTLSFGEEFTADYIYIYIFIQNNKASRSLITKYVHMGSRLFIFKMKEWVSCNHSGGEQKAKQ